MKDCTIYEVVHTESKNTKYLLQDPSTGETKLQIKERTKGITPYKTQFFISGANHKKYVSSVYPEFKPQGFTGSFQFEPYHNYKIEYKSQTYTLIFDSDTCVIKGWVNV